MIFLDPPEPLHELGAEVAQRATIRVAEEHAERQERRAERTVDYVLQLDRDLTRWHEEIGEVYEVPQPPTGPRSERRVARSDG